MNIIHAIKFLGWYFLRCEKVDQTKPLSWPGGFEGAGGGVTEQWVKDNFINSDASTYVLTSLESLFLDSSAKLAKITAEDKMPTTGSYTVLSLGWTYNDSNNAPALLAVELATHKLYFYQGTLESLSSNNWKEIIYKGDDLSIGNMTIESGKITVKSDGFPIGLKLDISSLLPLNPNADIGGEGNSRFVNGHFKYLQNNTVFLSPKKIGIPQDALGNLLISSSEIPTPKYELLNYFILYTGETTDNYKNNSIYKCVIDGTYKWIEICNLKNLQSTDVGMRGDYCSQYGVIQATAGLPTIGTGNSVNLPGGVVLKLQGTAADPTIKRTTLASPQTVTLTKTTDSILAYVEGVEGFQQCDKICFSPSEPPNDESTCRLWNDGTQMYFRDINHGDTWIPCRAAVLAELHYTDGVLTWLDFTGWYHLMPTTN